MFPDNHKQVRDLHAFVAQSGAALPASPQASGPMQPAPPSFTPAENAAVLPTLNPPSQPPPNGPEDSHHIDISGIPTTPPTEAPLTSFNSLNSSPAEAHDQGWPAPLGPAAFHGLAGEIVRLIDPHTEADPVALLLQFLTAFGNIIDRGAYIVADGARHYMNLFGVLVGETSKGRKGTSWQQIAGLLDRVDPIWRQNCVKSGLSSGEGVIFHVRDPLMGLKDGKKGGAAEPGGEMVVKDPGVADKRLFILEGEFANVLKVMAREGNTLSPVIRHAWDGSTLQTLTKNSPYCATGAHVSICGHITRDEVLRLLTQTEAANGFGNRFLWAAVKRSKCLPEGGQIDQVDFNCVIKRLHEVIQFARTACEIRRAEPTRELWRQVYPSLSEGKSGMFGAVTARAEAQVMRLSCLSALLDGSKLIQPEHHRAAMELWRYCEQSARWIFGTSTGDKNADKILAALRNAPNRVLRRTDIHTTVFKNNLSQHDLNEALKKLYLSGLAEGWRKDTGGAPLESWHAITQ